jgi:hypothetical protein
MSLRRAIDEVETACRELTELEFSVETTSVVGEVFWLAMFRRRKDETHWKCQRMDVRDAVIGALNELRKSGMVWGEKG